MQAEVSVGGFWHEKFQHKPWSSGIFELKCIHLDTSQEDKDLQHAYTAAYHLWHTFNVAEGMAIIDNQPHDCAKTAVKDIRSAFAWNWARHPFSAESHGSGL